MTKMRKPVTILLSTIFVVSLCSYVFAQECDRARDGHIVCTTDAPLVRKIGSNNYYALYLEFNGNDRFVNTFLDDCGSDRLKLVTSTGPTFNVNETEGTHFFEHLPDSFCSNCTRWQRLVFQITDETQQASIEVKIPYSDEFTTTTPNRTLKYRIMDVIITPSTSDDGIPFTVPAQAYGGTLPANCNTYSGPF